MEVGALFAPTLLLWGHFLPPFCYFGGAFCPHFYTEFNPVFIVSELRGRFLPPL